MVSIKIQIKQSTWITILVKKSKTNSNIKMRIEEHTSS